MPASRPDLSVLVVTHNGREAALDTLRSAKVAAAGLSVEWIVVDCGSEDGTPDAIADAHRDVDLVRRPNLGFAGGNNVGLARTTGRYVLLLNPDVLFLRGGLADVVDAMERRPAVGLSSVVQRAADGTTQWSIRRFPSVRRQLGEALWLHRLPGLAHWQEEVEDASAYGREQAADWLVGAFLCARREALEAVGELDERFFLYSEEKDWCRRFWSAGWEVRHLPVAEITHLSPGYIRPELAAQLTRSKLLFAHKHAAPLQRAGLWLSLILGHLLRLAAAGAAPSRDSSKRAGRARGQRLALGVALRRGCA